MWATFVVWQSNKYTTVFCWRDRRGRGRQREKRREDCLSINAEKYEKVIIVGSGPAQISFWGGEGARRGRSGEEIGLLIQLTIHCQLAFGCCVCSTAANRGRQPSTRPAPYVVESTSSRKGELATSFAQCARRDTTQGRTERYPTPAIPLAVTYVYHNVSPEGAMQSHHPFRGC